ncbi:MAG: bifunctional oligoribonuclease/PAP phosphatase NrnA [Clostridia bacterium]|nr:bifunctional oligoribonuclease/PAP phosphatase NrnA [Clostridia bacterium]
MSEWQKIKAYLQGQKNIILLVHEKPDGDCMGAALALAHHLQMEGYSPSLYNPDAIPMIYGFLPGQEMIKTYKDKRLPEGIPIIVIDCADQGRVRYVLPENVPIINIDHHVSNNYFGSYNLVDTKAAATGEIIYKLLVESEESINSFTATCLYVALSSDTGSFKYSNTTARTFRYASELVELGADMELIRYNLFERRPISELLMMKLALTNMKQSVDKRIIWTALSYRKLAENNLLQTDTDSVISLMRSTEGIEIAFVIKELEPNLVKVSLRSKKYFDVNVLANKFHGGGHSRAAGCTIKGDLNEIVINIISTAKGCLKDYCVEGDES